MFGFEWQRLLSSPSLFTTLAPRPPQDKSAPSLHAALKRDASCPSMRVQPPTALQINRSQGALDLSQDLSLSSGSPLQSQHSELGFSAGSPARSPAYRSTSSSNLAFPSVPARGKVCSVVVPSSACSTPTGRTHSYSPTAGTPGHAAPEKRASRLGSVTSPHPPTPSDRFSPSARDPLTLARTSGV